ncbi:alpha/beta hydrolase fold domain-containing protein [Halalkalicoccus tibetensis]|uniref:Alpha/beta hydrolase fold domain-containing protein n=1 Tax=Halalkalicoccus tibetensis TaxID=175632 RepID=A0ABD5V2R4_9EURY
MIDGPNGSIPIRNYDPDSTTEDSQSALLFFHGGGWVVGDLETHDLVAHALANAADCLVVTVDYHRTPETPFPVPLEDCYAID